MTRRKLVFLLFISLFTSLAIASDQAEDDAFELNYRESAGLPYPMLILDLDEQIEWLLLVSAAAPPDLSHKIEAIKSSIYEALAKEFCARDNSEVPSRLDKRTAATRSLVAALSPMHVEARDRGAIAATLVRIIEQKPDRFCLHD